MPELIEVEVYRQVVDRLVGETLAEVDAPDAWFVKGGATPDEVIDAVQGATVRSTSRLGKLLLVDLGPDRPTLGLRFGMTGRVLLDGYAPIEQLEYGPRREDPAWVRFAMRTEGGVWLRLSDPRRLGAVELDPDVAAMGLEASTVTTAQLRRVLTGSTTALKARLLDQARLAGLGNLLADETLWRTGLDPARPAGGLSDAELRRLATGIRRTVADLSERGGSHLGDLQDERRRDGRCPRDGTVLARRTVGGRTTYSCPKHQR